jgi:hypothetical protein
VNVHPRSLPRVTRGENPSRQRQVASTGALSLAAAGGRRRAKPMRHRRRRAFLPLLRGATAWAWRGLAGGSTAAAPQRREGGALAAPMARGGGLLRMGELAGRCWRRLVTGPDWAWMSRASHGSSDGAASARRGGAAAAGQPAWGPPPLTPGWNTVEPAGIDSRRRGGGLDLRPVPLRWPWFLARGSELVEAGVVSAAVAWRLSSWW